MQSVVITIEEKIFSTCSAHIHCWARDVFSIGPPRDYINGTELNQITVERKRERRRRMENVLGSHPM
jgi:hypothetical protein